MQGFQGENSNRSSKRMRLGTKSCAECRRRKVRCTFKDGQTSCEECVAHDARCIPQELGFQKLSQRGYEGDVQQRLEELEGLVGHICRAIDIDMHSVSLSQFKASTAQALKRLRSASSPGSAASINFASSSSTSESGILDEAPIHQDALEDAPLITLFKDAMYIQEDFNQHVDGSRATRSIDSRYTACIETLSTSLPNSQSLLSILQLTQRYWFVWPVQAKDLVTSSDRLQPVSGPGSAREYILNSLGARVPAIAAKAIAWLALCIQQLDIDSVRQWRLPAPQRYLLHSYLDAAETLLAINDDSARKIEDVECLILQAKLYLNMGKPRRAWLRVRSALNISFLLRLHQVRADTDDRPKYLWRNVWQFDRQLSMILGLPYGVVESHPGLSRDLADIHFLAKGMHELGIIAGHITERNQDLDSIDYATTMKIDRELESCQAAIPIGWWNAVETLDTPFEEVYHRQLYKIYYYQALKLLHQPYMLKSSTNKAFEYSRNAAINASRGLLSAYKILRDTSSGEVMCDLMDFQAFSGALLMIIDLLSRPIDGINQDTEDWAIVGSIVERLDSVDKTMECTVAGQAARLLEHLILFRNGTNSFVEGHEAVIPYFGKVRIGKLKTPELAVAITPQGLDRGQNTVEFNMSYLPFDEDATIARNLHDAELGVDWASVLNVDVDYDWSQAFELRGLG